MKSGFHGVESRIQNEEPEIPLPNGLPYIGRLSCTFAQERILILIYIKKSKTSKLPIAMCYIADFVLLADMFNLIQVVFSKSFHLFHGLSNVLVTFKYKPFDSSAGQPINGTKRIRR